MSVKMRTVVLLLFGGISIPCMSQQTAQERLDIVELVDRSNKLFNSAIGDGGDIKDRDWNNFERLFYSDAEVANDMFVLNPSLKPIALKGSLTDNELNSRTKTEDLDDVALGYLQNWRHLYDKVPKFNVEVLHVTTAPSNVQGLRCLVEKTVRSRGQLLDKEGQHRVNLDSIESHLTETRYPIRLWYTVDTVGFGEGNWHISKIEFEAPKRNWHQLIQVGIEGIPASEWDFDSFRWGEHDVMDLGKGLYYVISDDSRIKVEYDHPSFFEQTRCNDAASLDIGLQPWLAAIEKENPALETASIYFKPSRWRLDLGVFSSLSDVVGLQFNDESATSMQQVFGHMGFWRSVKIDDPNKISGLYVSVGFGRMEQIWQTKEFGMNADAIDPDGDSYIRQVSWFDVNQKTNSKGSELRVGYEHASRQNGSWLSTESMELWTGFRVLGGVGTVSSSQSTIEFGRLTTGLYPLLYGITLDDEGIYDFGYAESEVEVQVDANYTLTADVEWVSRWTKNSGTGIYLALGMRTLGKIQKESVFGVDDPPDFASINNSAVSLFPTVQIGITMRLNPRDPEGCN